MSKKIKTVKPKKELTEMQKRNLALRKELNSYVDPHAIRPFSPGKPLTYLMLFLLPPYGLYRLWKMDLGFTRSEKVVQTMISVLFVYFLIETFLLVK
jgi:hypothetical protein